MGNKILARIEKLVNRGIVPSRPRHPQDTKPDSLRALLAGAVSQFLKLPLFSATKLIKWSPRRLLGN